MKNKKHKKSFIRTPYEVQEEALKEYMEQLDAMLGEILTKQEYLYEVQSFTMNMLTAIKNALQRNAYISEAQLNREINELIKKNEEFKKDIKNNDFILENLDSEDMASA